MKTIEVKTSELEGAALDWAVARADGADELKVVPWGDGKTVSCIYWLPDGGCWANHYSPSTDWGQGGPLIEKYDPEERRLVEDGRFAEVWLDLRGGDAKFGRGVGPTRLIAACRAIVAAKLGEVVEVPGELLG